MAALATRAPRSVQHPLRVCRTVSGGRSASRPHIFHSDWAIRLAHLLGSPSRLPAHAPSLWSSSSSSSSSLYSSLSFSCPSFLCLYEFPTLVCMQKKARWPGRLQISRSGDARGAAFLTLSLFTSLIIIRGLWGFQEPRLAWHSTLSILVTPSCHYFPLYTYIFLHRHKYAATSRFIIHGPRSGSDFHCMANAAHGK